MQDKLGETWDVSAWPVEYAADVPRQGNGWDCGMFALLFANRLGLGTPFDFRQADLLRDARVRVACELMDCRVAAAAPAPKRRKQRRRRGG